MNTRNHFQRGAGVFTCKLCDRRTRGIPDSVSLELCGQCYDLCGEDNQHNDDGTTPLPEELTGYNKQLTIIGERGGDTAKVRDFCSYLWA